MKLHRFRPTRALVPAALLAVLALAGCTSSGAGDAAGAPVVQLGAPGEPNRTLSPEEAAALEVPGPTEADVAFLRGMIPHHEQALEMTALVAQHRPGTDLALFAERMDVSQRDEIDTFTAWLAEHADVAGGSGPRGPAHGGHDDDAHGDGGHLMPGMASPEEMSALAEARGTEFDRLFLELMVRHHEGAIAMVEDLFEAGGGQDATVYQLAQHVRSDQEIEITRMLAMLEDLDAGGS